MELIFRKDVTMYVREYKEYHNQYTPSPLTPSATDSHSKDIINGLFYKVKGMIVSKIIQRVSPLWILIPLMPVSWVVAGYSIIWLWQDVQIFFS